MCENSQDVYTLKTFRQKLKDRYKEHILFVTDGGKKPGLIYFRNTADYAIKKLKNEGETREAVLRAAAKIIKEDIRSMEASGDSYPSNFSSLENAYWLPDSLMLVLKYLVPNDLKRVSLGQCIIQASRPRSIVAPIPFGVGVSVEKKIRIKMVADVFV